MDVRNNLDGLRSLLGVNPTATPATQQKGGPAASEGQAWDGDRATLSSAANGLSESAMGEGVRADKVATVQAALAAGTYHVPALAVASKVVDAMLAPGS